MPLFDGLTQNDGVRFEMWGILPGEVRMQKRLAALGPQSWTTEHGQLRGHTFHHSLTESPLTPIAQTQRGSAYGKTEAIYGQGSVRASYFHAWFASHPKAAASLFLTESV